MRLILLFSLLFICPLLWDAYSATGSHRHLAEGPMLTIQIRPEASVSTQPAALNPGETLVFHAASDPRETEAISLQK